MTYRERLDKIRSLAGVRDERSVFMDVDGVLDEIAGLADWHASDCATHNEPAYEAGPCTCTADEPFGVREFREYHAAHADRDCTRLCRAAFLSGFAAAAERAHGRAAA